MRSAFAHLALLASLGASAALAAEVSPLSLADAAAIALRESPSVAMSRAGEDVAAARVTRARAAWLPEIGVSEAWARGNNPVFVFGSLLEQGRFGPANFDPLFLNDPPELTNWRRAVAVRYAVFDQFRRWSANGQASKAAAQAGLASESARQQLRLELIQAYFGLQLARERASVAAGAVRTAEAGAESVRSRFDAGVVAQSELLGAEVQLAEFRQRSIEAEGGVAVASAGLDRLLHRPLSDSPELATFMTDRPFPELTLEGALTEGEQRRPELRARTLATSIARLDLRSARGSLLPRIDAFGTIGASGSRIGDADSDHTAGVTLSWSLLDPARVGRVREARAGLEIARQAEIAASDGVELEIVSAFYRFRAAKEKLEVGRRSVEQAESAARMVRDRYEQGLTTITEELRAQAALLAARMSLLGARYDCYMGYAELLRATGGLHDVEPFL